MFKLDTKKKETSELKAQYLKVIVVQTLYIKHRQHT
jgi:hypothetical protein